MRAAQIVDLGQPPQVAELPEPEGAGLAIEAVALNPLDLAIAKGVFYGGHPPLPYVPGCEAVARTAEGRLVYLFGAGRGISKDGFLAERVPDPPSPALELPEDVDPAIAVAAGIAGIAAWVSVAWKAKVRPGDRVLVLGASGTVGRIAVQAARMLGADQVVGASRKDGDGLIPLDEIGDAFPDGYTVGIDPLWGEPLAHALQFAAPHARVVHLGQAAGPEAPLRSADVRGKELQILGHSNFALTPDERNRAHLELLDHLLAGRIRLDVETHPLEDVAPAWGRQQAGAKVVISMAG